MRDTRSALSIATVGSTIEALNIDALDVEDRLDLIQALRISLQTNSGAVMMDAPRAAGFRCWLDAPAADSVPTMYMTDDGILAGISARL
jgi:hypothetical protein